MIKHWQVLKTIFPSVITDNFDFVSFQETDARIDYWLDEREWLEREDYKLGTIRFHAFSPEKIIQDFPIRGRSVYLHVRRRRWYDSATDETFSYSYSELVEAGTKLSPEFAAFLKEED